MNFIKKGTLLIGISENFKYNSKIACFSFKGTLIIPKKKTNFIDEYDFKILYNNLIEKLNEIKELGGSIIIFENFYEDINLKSMIEMFINKINKNNKYKIDIIFIASLKSNKYSKPYTNMFKILELLYKNNNSSINRNESIYIGHQGGRLETRYYNKYDRNCSDRSFAYNLGIKYSIPENFFKNSVTKLYWEWNYQIPTIKMRKNKLKEQLKKKELDDKDNNNMELSVSKIIKENLIEGSNYIIIIIGLLSSGKTTLIEEIKKEKKSLIVELNKKLQYGSKEKIIKEIKKLNKKNNIIIELNNISILYYLLENIKLKKIPVLLIETNLKDSFCKLLNNIKIQTTEYIDIELISKTKFNNYKKKYDNIWNKSKRSVSYKKNDKNNRLYYYKKKKIIINDSKYYWYQY
tara:strand:+ start:4329 stop:5546 length:1218 start_codon:yes stop_codon:yes gene_type:complete